MLKLPNLPDYIWMAIGIFFVIYILAFILALYRYRSIIIPAAKGGGMKRGPYEKKRFLGTAAASLMVFLLASLLALFQAGLLYRYALSFIFTAFFLFLVYGYWKWSKHKTNPFEEVGLVFVALFVFIFINWLAGKYNFPLTIMSLSFLGGSSMGLMVISGVIIILLLIVIADVIKK
ncbi:MAG: hypothetical protein QXF83_06900 [Candidatus Bathyarchaeia archaeon]